MRWFARPHVRGLQKYSAESPPHFCLQSGLRGLSWLCILLALAFPVVSAAADCVPAPAGLVSWWPGDGDARDIAGTNNGSLQGGATASSPGLDGSAFSFDGTNGFVQIPDSASLRLTNLTVEAWVRFSSLDSPGNSSPGDQYIVFKENSGTNSGNFEGFALTKARGTNGDTLVFGVSSPSGQTAAVGSATLVGAGVWYHVAGVRGPDFLELYVNGQLESQTNVSFAQDYGNWPLYFGTSGQAYWDHKFAGLLDEVSLYNRALSSGEIAAIYGAGATGKCKGVIIKAQPQNQTVTVGSVATFGVTATGFGALGYQWQFNGAALPAATSTSLILAHPQPSDSGNYTVVVSNSLGAVTSAVAVLTVWVPPMILNPDQPVSLIVEAGGTASFSVAASGTQPLTYQWQLGGANLADHGRTSGATASTLRISCVQPGDAGSYSVLISNVAGIVRSASATLAVTQMVAIADPQLMAAVLCALSKTNCGWLTSTDLQALTRLSADDYGITNLYGLGWASNLSELSLSGNAISDLSPLQQLTQLTRLNLERNSVGDISALAGLANLSSLVLNGNPIKDYSPLAGLSRLSSLSAHDGGITNLAFVQNLSRLIELNLYNNRCADISSLRSLTNLNLLDLRWNPVTNQMMLSTLTNLSRLYLGATSLTNLNFLAGLSQLSFLNLEYNQIQDLAPLASLTNLSYLALNGNPITNFGVLSDTSGLVNLELRGNSISDISFLRNLPLLRFADLAFTNVRDLSPLVGRTNLSLVLDGSTNIDYTTLSSLTNVTRVWLAGNSISNVAFLQNLTNLTALGLEDNRIADFSPLTALPQLTSLGLSRNPASNLALVASLTNLTGLRLEGSAITDASFLTNLPQLTFLSLNNNRVSDLSQFGLLTNLCSLYLSHNRLTNIAALVALPQLHFVDVSRELFAVDAGSAAGPLVQNLRCQGVDAAYLPTNQLTLSVVLPTFPDWYIPATRSSSLGFWVYDLVASADELLVNVSSSNQGVIPDSGLSLSGTNNARTLTVAPAVVGTVTNTLTVMDAPGGLSTSAHIITHVLLPDPNFGIPDPALSNSISGAVGRTGGYLTSVDLLDLTSLGLFDQPIGDLSGLERATNLRSLAVENGSVSNLTTLQTLTNLTFLSLYGNRVTDISPLAALTNLSYLDLGSNPLTNYTALAALTNLSTLLLEGNSISNLSFLTNLTGLVTLDLGTNHITDVSPLVGLTNLNFLLLEQNRLANIGTLTNLPQLRYVDLQLNLINVSNNPVIDVLQRQYTFVADLPQRSAPTIDVRTNWLVAPQTTPSLSFNIWDSGPVDQRLGVGVTCTGADLGCSLGPGSGHDGSSLWTLLVTPTLSPNETNSVTLSATNDVGYSASATISVVTTIFLPVNGQLLGDPGTIWNSGGDVPWFGQAIVTHAGHAVAQSGAIGNYDESLLQTTVVGPGRLEFWWKVSSETNGDWLEFDVTGQTNRVSGEVDWQPEIANVPPGTQTLTWRYYKNGATSRGLDAGWLDQVSFQPQPWVLSLPIQTNRTTTELTTLMVTNSITDPSIPANVLTYQLANPPAGAVIDSNGVIHWTPTKAQTHNAYPITTLVTANGVPGLTASNSFLVTVRGRYDQIDLSDPYQALADPDGDGLSNLMKYAVGTDPRNPADASAGMVVGIVVDGGSQHAGMRFKRRTNAAALQLQYVPEVSSDKRIWYSDSANVAGVSVVPFDPQFDWVTVKDLRAITSNSPRFIRLRVMYDPAQALADSDGDGLSNLMEYALGTDPNNGADASAGIMVWTLKDSGGRYLAMSFKQRADAAALELQYVPEVSGDKQTWYSDSANVLVLSVMPLDSQFNWVSVRDLTPITPTAPRFFRLRFLAH